MEAGMTYMLEPNPITMDGKRGLFYGHAYVLTENGKERVTDCSYELLIADW